MDAHRARRHAAHRPSRGGPEESEHRVRGGDRASVCGESRARRLQDDRWRQDVEEGALQGREHRRGRGGDRSGESGDRVRGTLEYATSAVVHVLADERPGRRHLQVDRRRHDVEAAHERPAQRGNRQDRYRDSAQQSAARVCGGRLPRAGSERAGTRRWRRRRRGTRRRQSGVCAGAGGAGAGRILPLRRRGRDVDQAVERSRALGTRLVFRARRRRSEERRHRLCAECRGFAIQGRRQDVGCAARVAGRRRLPSGVGLARRLEHDDRGERPGHDHHAQREHRRSARRHVELVAQPADGADLPLLGRLSVAVLGDRRAAGHGRRRRALARQVRPRSRCATGSRSAPAARAATTAGDPLHPGIVFGGTGQRFDLETNTAVAGTTAPRTPDCARTDWTQPLVFSKADPQGALLLQPIRFQDDRWRADLDADQRRSHASRPGHSGKPRRDRRGAGGSQRQARRRLHDRALAAARADGLGRHGRRARFTSRPTTARPGRT